MLREKVGLLLKEERVAQFLTHNEPGMSVFTACGQTRSMHTVYQLQIHTVHTAVDQLQTQPVHALYTNCNIFRAIKDSL